MVRLDELCDANARFCVLLLPSAQSQMCEIPARKSKWARSLRTGADWRRWRMDNAMMAVTARSDSCMCVCEEAAPRPDRAAAHAHTHTHVHTYKVEFIHIQVRKGCFGRKQFHTGLSSTYEVLPMACLSSSILACVLSSKYGKLHNFSYVTSHTATSQAITCLTRSATSLQHCWPKPLHHQSIIHDQKPETFGLRWLRLGEVRFRMKFFCSTLRETG